MLKKLTLNKDFINKAVKFMSIIMLAFILLIMFFVDTRVEYNYRNDVKLNNYIFFLVAFLIIGILFALKKLLKNKQDKVQKIISKIESKSTLIIVILFILLIIFQVLMIRNLYFETKWDLEHVIGTLRNFLETGVFDNHAYIGTYPYFSIYPNNLFLANLFCVIGKMVMVFFQEKYVYGALVIIGTIICSRPFPFVLSGLPRRRCHPRWWKQPGSGLQGYLPSWSSSWLRCLPSWPLWPRRAVHPRRCGCEKG